MLEAIDPIIVEEPQAIDESVTVGYPTGRPIACLLYTSRCV